MSRNLSIVMYHYVRPIKKSNFPGIKGLEVSDFIAQLDFLCENYNFVTVDELNNSLKTGAVLPTNSCWLTFDDGYKDHFDYVSPILKDRGIQGAFFPPSAAILEHELLNVNAIHHILASGVDIDKLTSLLDSHCYENGLSFEKIRSFKHSYCKSNRWDCPKTIYFKRMLQHVLEPDLRNHILNSMFENVLGVTTTEFAKSLYMSCEELKVLVDDGMYVGSHGASHLWLDKYDKKDQKTDIQNSLYLLEEVGAPTSEWVMCYPYGAYNSDTIEIIKSLSCSIGITTKPEVASLVLDDRYQLPRLDTKDFYPVK